jgi:hypothetical protein
MIGMDDKIQDEDLAKADIRDHERRLSERAPWESTWRAIDERFPDAAGGFNQMSPGAIRGQQNFDVTHVNSNERFAAAGVAITTPQERDYIKPRFSAELMKIREVKLWCEQAGSRLYDIRYAARAGFGISVNEDWDQLGRYGTSAVWTDRKEDGTSLFYRAIHLSEITIDVDEANLVDTVDRKYTRTARQLEAFFGRDGLTPKMLEALGTPGKEHTEFEILHVVCPNRSWDRDKFDWRAFPIASRYLAVGEKLYLRRKGYHTMPISVSRHLTSPGEKYGRSPGIKMLPTINGLNAMKHTALRAGHKATDPALLFYNEDNITRLASKPGGMNPGLVNEAGNPLVARMPGGENGIPYALEMMQAEQQDIKTAFLEEFYKILTDPNSRMTTTEVLEVMSKQGILVRPYASRYETEKQNPQSQRELDLALRWGQLPPFPPEVLEAGAWPVIDYDNMLAAMAKAESTGKGLRFLELLAPIAQSKPDVYDWVDEDEMVPGLADNIGVPASWVRDKKGVAAIRANRAEQQQDAVDTEQLAQGAGAFLDVAKANQISQAA